MRRNCSCEPAYSSIDKKFTKQQLAHRFAYVQRREKQVVNGRRQPIEFIKRGRVGSPKGNPVSCHVFTLRIFFFPEYVNMTQFMKKYMIQTLYMDAWDLGTFYIGDQLFLGVSQLGGKSFVIYKWDSEHRYAIFFFFYFPPKV